MIPLLLLLAAGTVRAQELSTTPRIAMSDPMSVAITARGGATLAAPRGEFPSLIIGESRRGTGGIGQQYGAGAVGSRFDVAALIPFHPDFGVSLVFGSQLLSVTYPADSLRYPTRFDVQSLQGSIGVQWSALHELRSYDFGGLRSIYVDAGVDIGLATIGNRVESTSYEDTLGGGRKPVDGSFTSGEPFRNVIGLRVGVGLRFAPSPNIEIVLETSYSQSLNAVFSSEAIEANDFAMDAMRVLAGVGWRF